MISCAKCGKDNQDHYKFCLGCGAELSKDSGAPQASHTPPHGVESAGSATAMIQPESAPTGSPPAKEPEADSPGEAVQDAAPAPGSPSCPQCGHANGPGNRFCAGCGYNLTASADVPAASAGVGLRLTALRADGTEAGSYDLPNEPRVVVGRDTGSIFAGDSYLSPRHASIARRDGAVTVRDEGSLNGVYLRLQPDSPWPLAMGDIFRIGQEIIRVEALEGQSPTADGVERLGSPKEGYVARLALVIGRDTTGNAFPVPQSGVHCGRERGDILFSEDGYVSGLHCSIAPGSDGKLYLTDVGSSNGTFVRLGQEQLLSAGDILLMGQQLFRVDQL